MNYLDTDSSLVEKHRETGLHVVNAPFFRPDVAKSRRSVVQCDEVHHFFSSAAITARTTEVARAHERMEMIL